MNKKTKTTKEMYTLQIVYKSGAIQHVRDLQTTEAENFFHDWQSLITGQSKKPNQTLDSRWVSVQFQNGASYNINIGDVSSIGIIPG